MLHTVIIGTATEFMTRTLHIDIIRHCPLTVTPFWYHGKIFSRGLDYPLVFSPNDRAFISLQP